MHMPPNTSVEGTYAGGGGGVGAAFNKGVN
jgi:hypothetical protein